MLATEETQPRSPLLDPHTDEPGVGAPGCLVLALVGVIVLAFATIIVVLSATAGWTQGAQMAQVNATAEMSGLILEQCEGIPAELAAGNDVWLRARLDWLATLTPAPDCLVQYAPSATAFFNARQATATPTPSPEPTSATPEATADTNAVDAGATPGPGGSYDLNALLAEAQQHVAVGDWEAAIETLDLIIAIDPSFETATVNSLISQALNSYATFLYNAGRPAEAIVITDRAEQYGPLAEGLSYERYAAELYLNATRAIGISFDESIRLLRIVYDLGPGRYYDEVNRLLYEQYLAYGDALVAQGNPCFAVVQYGNALNYLNTPEAVSRRDNAQVTCNTTPPTQDPSLIPTSVATPDPSGGVAPIGERP